MSKFLLSLLCSQSGIVSSASWGSHRLGEAVLSDQQGTEPACLSQLLSQHPRDPPTSTSASLSFSERLVKLSDQSTCQMPGSRRAPRGWTELSQIQTGPSHSLLLQTLPGPNPHPAEACLIRPLQPLTSAGPSLSRLNPWLSTARDLLHPSVALTSPLPPRALPPHSPGQLL